MRYFKYNHPKKTEKEINKAERAAFDKNERMLLRKEKFFCILGNVILFAIGLTIFAIVSSFFAGVHLPESNIFFVSLLFIIIEIILKILFFIISIIIAAIAGAFCAWPFWNLQHKYYQKLRSIRRDHLHGISQKACEHLHKYYGLREPSITTKCYGSTDNRFKNKDIVIFERDGEIRIMRSLWGSVNLSENDIGCYTFGKGEFSLCYTEYKGKHAAKLTVGETAFTLSARAKPFIERLSRYDDDGIFLPAQEKKSGSSAYYEFSFCKKNMPIEKLLESGYTYWSEDSLLFHMDDDARFFEYYAKYFENPHSPDGTGRFFYAGVNYYTAEETKKILTKIEKDAPPYSAPLIKWLREAEKYNGIFFLGI